MEQTKSDDSEIWQQHKEDQRRKRQNNKRFSTDLLIENDIPFESFKNGDHLHVKKNGFSIDYWPATGLWIDRKTKKKQRGVYNLIKYLNLNQSKLF